MYMGMVRVFRHRPVIESLLIRNGVVLGSLSDAVTLPCQERPNRDHRSRGNRPRTTPFQPTAAVNDREVARALEAGREGLD